MEIFWRTIAYYNSATWLLQIVIILIGIALTGLLIGRPRPWVKMAMKFYMIGLYTWISLVYYYIYCEERSYNGVMAMFWGVMAIIWIWDAITGYTTFERTHKYDLLSYVLLAMPFIYHRIVIAVCAKGQYVFGIVPLPLVADRIIQNLFLSDSGRFLVGKCHDPRPVSFLQGVFPE